MRFCKKCAKQATEESKICRQCGGILEDIPDAEVVGESAPPRVAAPPKRASKSPPHRVPESPRTRVPESPRTRVPESPPAHAKEYARPEKPGSRRAALGLPSGSIRALLTLLIVAVVVVQVVRGGEVELLWTETLMIALAHYFTSRRLVNLSPELIRRLTAEGQVEPESNPLYLPKHSIRTIIVLAFVGLTVYLFKEHRLVDSQALPLLGVVFAYMLGIVARAKNFQGFEDLKAAIVVGVLAYAAGAYLWERPDLVPHALRNTALASVFTGDHRLPPLKLRIFVGWVS
ncbi:MAG: hypothetical protein NTY19_29460 [Planctomycetota bacterium]|nr:hypothetical protein [Planctomycetota bacterium]